MLKKNSIKISCLSDLHGFFPDNLPGGDLLITAGDMTAKDTPQQWKEFIEWLDKQNYRKKIFIAGNHDNFLQKSMEGMVTIVGMFETDKEKVFLCDSGIEWEGLKIWGSPWTKTFTGMNPHCKAFTVDTEEELEEKWSLIPDDIDILVTHIPPFGILDEIHREVFCGERDECVGSTSLRNLVFSGERFKKLKLHVFGHVHECGGRIFETTLCKFINASYVDEYYKPRKSPIIRIDV